jgi:transcriptional regulator
MIQTELENIIYITQYYNQKIVNYKKTLKITNFTNCNFVITTCNFQGSRILFLNNRIFKKKNIQHIKDDRRYKQSY